MASGPNLPPPPGSKKGGGSNGLPPPPKVGSSSSSRSGSAERTVKKMLSKGLRPYYSTTVPWFDRYVKQSWPKGFVQQYEAAGGQGFLRTLNYAWG